MKLCRFSSFHPPPKDTRDTEEARRAEKKKSLSLYQLVLAVSQRRVERLIKTQNNTGFIYISFTSSEPGSQFETKKLFLLQLVIVCLDILSNLTLLK